MTDTNSEISEDVHKDLFLKKIGKNILKLRLADGTSQKDLAKDAGLHPTYLNEVEKGRRNFAMETLLKISRALDIAPKKLLKDTDKYLLINEQSKEE